MFKSYSLDRCRRIFLLSGGGDVSPRQFSRHCISVIICFVTGPGTVILDLWDIRHIASLSWLSINYCRHLPEAIEWHTSYWIGRGQRTRMDSFQVWFRSSCGKQQGGVFAHPCCLSTSLSSSMCSYNEIHKNSMSKILRYRSSKPSERWR